jgi:hypothetical protein
MKKNLAFRGLIGWAEASRRVLDVGKICTEPFLPGYPHAGVGKGWAPSRQKCSGMTSEGDGSG